MNPTPSYVPTHNASSWPLNPNAGQGDSSLTATLIVKHLPEAILQETLSRLFSHYGSSAVRPCSGGRLRFLGKVLKLERAGNFSKDNKIEAREGPLRKDVFLSSMQKEVLLSHDRNESLKPRSYHTSEPIAPKLGVLRLMNKMNIPAPFRMALHTLPLPASAPPPPLSAERKSSPADMPSSESELESSEEEAGNNALSLKAKSGWKRPRKEVILGPAVDKDVARESVGVKLAALVRKEMPMIKKKIPVLQNYTAGNPTPVLYIKNFDKCMVLEDFYYIFGSLSGNVDEAKSSINVKLMQEGRMRGQAFVTFPSVELAHHAFVGTVIATLLLSSSNLVNGYVFKTSQ